nr:uncharacterized protein LOC116776784 [Danaus plexippus plexippus]
MSKMAQVVEGEASESDSEIEEGKSPDSSACSKAFVISGEAPESDDESKIQSPTLDELDAPLHTSMFPASPTKLMHNSILHQKLWECNVSLRATIEGLVRNSTSICVEKLMTSDRILLSVQVRRDQTPHHSLYSPCWVHPCGERSFNNAWDLRPRCKFKLTLSNSY